MVGPPQVDKLSDVCRLQVIRVTQPGHEHDGFGRQVRGYLLCRHIDHLPPLAHPTAREPDQAT